MNEVGAFAANDETLPMAEYAIRKRSGYGLSHAMIMGANTDFTGTPHEHLPGDAMFHHFRSIFRGALIANVGMVAERTNRLIAFGRPFIANPDLVERLAASAPLTEIDWNTVYAPGAHVYTDYPRYITSTNA